MISISRVSTVAGSLALGLWAGMSSSFAEEPITQKFGTWTVTIQPGVRGSGLTDRGSPSGSAPVRFVSQTELPPAPSPGVPDGIEIAADASVPVNGSAPCASGTQRDPRDLVRLYSQVYNSIPFSRAEFNATPSYRHDATMEFLFGQMRPTIIQRGTTVIRNRNSAMPAGYGGYGNGFGYQYNQYGFNSYFYPFYNIPIYRPYDLW